jgi:anti-anti-sigma factor
MFDIKLGPSGEVLMTGRLDAAQAEAALHFLDAAPEAHLIDLAGLEYIASAGLRVFLLTQKRLRGSGGALRLINVRASIHDIFRYAGFDQIIDMALATD